MRDDTLSDIEAATIVPEEVPESTKKAVESPRLAGAAHGAREGLPAFIDGLLRFREENFGDIFSNRDLVRQIGMLLAVIFVLSAFHGLPWE